MNTDLYHISFVNLAYRSDRHHQMIAELEKAQIPAVRFNAIHWKDRTWGPKYQKMYRRTPGACGCHESQTSIMREALQLDKHAWVMEDDLHFCEDFQRRFDYIEDWMGRNEWDVFWLGSSFHIPAWWHKKGHRERELEDCGCNLRRDAETTGDPRIIRTYGAFCTFNYIVNKNSIQKILDLFDVHLHTSIGIDWLFIKLQPKLKCFSFVPGPSRQIDNQSDIGNGMTIWSGFLQLNGTKENSSYVFQERMEDFNPQLFQWGECNNRNT